MMNMGVVTSRAFLPNNFANLRVVNDGRTSGTASLYGKTDSFEPHFGRRRAPAYVAVAAGALLALTACSGAASGPPEKYNEVSVETVQNIPLVYALTDGNSYDSHIANSCKKAADNALKDLPQAQLDSIEKLLCYYQGREGFKDIYSVQIIWKDAPASTAPTTSVSKK
jgi:hypothetical protein